MTFFFYVEIVLWPSSIPGEPVLRGGKPRTLSACFLAPTLESEFFPKGHEHQSVYMMKITVY